jgi:hypothetical protein
MIFWTACILAELCLTIGWISYQGADRAQGEPDAEVFQQQRSSGLP